jgi:hypothetical protein
MVHTEPVRQGEHCTSLKVIRISSIRPFVGHSIIFVHASLVLRQRVHFVDVLWVKIAECFIIFCFIDIRCIWL